MRRAKEQQAAAIRLSDLQVADLAARMQASGGTLLIPFRLAHECGLTDEEIVRLRWEDVHFASRCVMVTRSLREKRHTSGITAGITQALQTLRQGLGTLPEMVCLDAGGSPYTLASIRAALADVCGQLHITGVGWQTVHDCWLRRQGLDPQPAAD